MRKTYRLSQLITEDKLSSIHQIALKQLFENVTRTQSTEVSKKMTIAQGDYCFELTIDRPIFILPQSHRCPYLTVLIGDKALDYQMGDYTQYQIQYALYYDKGDHLHLKKSKKMIFFGPEGSEIVQYYQQLYGHILEPVKNTNPIQQPLGQMITQKRLANIEKYLKGNINLPARCQLILSLVEEFYCLMNTLNHLPLFSPKQIYYDKDRTHIYINPHPEISHQSDLKQPFNEKLRFQKAFFFFAERNIDTREKNALNLAMLIFYCLFNEDDFFIQLHKISCRTESIPLFLEELAQHCAQLFKPFTKNIPSLIPILDCFKALLIEPLNWNASIANLLEASQKYNRIISHTTMPRQEAPQITASLAEIYLNELHVILTQMQSQFLTVKDKLPTQLQGILDQTETEDSIPEKFTQVSQLAKKAANDSFIIQKIKQRTALTQNFYQHLAKINKQPLHHSLSELNHFKQIFFEEKNPVSSSKTSAVKAIYFNESLC